MKASNFVILWSELRTAASNLEVETFVQDFTTFKTVPVAVNMFIALASCFFKIIQYPNILIILS